MFAGFLLNGYQTAIPELAPFANLTWFGWTDDHIPLAAQLDWASMGLATGRVASERLSTSFWWGIGLGVFRLVIASSGGSFIEQVGNSPVFTEAIGTLFPGIDFATIGGFLQLVFIEFGLVIAGLASAALVSGWASDETSGRLEMLLATPLTRIRWLVSGGLGLIIGVAVVVLVSISSPPPSIFRTGSRGLP